MKEKSSFLQILSMKVQMFSCSVVPDSETPWTVARQAPLSMGFPRQEYWSGLSCPSPGVLPNPRIEPRSPALQEDFLLSEPSGILRILCELIVLLKVYM